MSSGKSPVKSSRSGSLGDSHSKQPSSQKDTKAARRLLSSSTEKTDEPTSLKKATPGKLQPPRSRTKSESSDKEESEGQKKSKAELRAERRAIQVGTGIVYCFNNPY